jgi:predicted RecA/RadA family phage recombinase
MAATFYKGAAPLMVDHTPAAAVAAGQVLVLGNAVRIAKQDIPADVKGALCAGGALFKVDKAVGGGVTFADGAPVDIDETTQLAVATTTGDAHMGLAVGAAANGDDHVIVHLMAPKNA